jgi:hypothetical protein
MVIHILDKKIAPRKFFDFSKKIKKFAGSYLFINFIDRRLTTLKNPSKGPDSFPKGKFLSKCNDTTAELIKNKPKFEEKTATPF